MNRFFCIVLGYHGCGLDYAEALIRGEETMEAWRFSENPYDWLGHGIYFWEFAPKRAKAWSKKGGVVGAVIQLGICLDLTDIDNTAALAREFEIIRVLYERQGIPLPENKGKWRDLDCLTINELLAAAKENAGFEYQTVRCPFLEGEPVFPGSGILRESHIQVSVRDRSCILGIFRPNLS